MIEVDLQLLYYEGADRVRGRGEMRGREGGEEGEGGGRRGGGRREKRGEGGGRRGGGRRERGGGKGREGKRGKFCAREARAAPEGRRETRGREGGGKGAGGGRGLPPCPPPLLLTCLIDVGCEGCCMQQEMLTLPRAPGPMSGYLCFGVRNSYWSDRKFHVLSCPVGLSDWKTV